MGADEFRDYILGFIFFKFLSERMESFANDILEGEDFKIMKAKKKYAVGGKVDPKEVLETMTKSRLAQALKDAGVGVPYGTAAKGTRKETASDTGFKSGADYSLADLTKMAKTKGVYQDARMKAVADFRKK